jgi:hypothetical protein
MKITEELIKKIILKEFDAAAEEVLPGMGIKNEQNKMNMKKSEAILRAVENLESDPDESVYFSPEEIEGLKDLLSGYFTGKVEAI